MRKNLEHVFSARFAALLCAAALLAGALCGCGKNSGTLDDTAQDSVQASAGTQGANSGENSGDAAGEKADVQEIEPTIVGSWKVTNASQSSAALIYDFRADGTVGFSIADFGDMDESKYGSALMYYLREGSYTYDADTGELSMETTLCGLKSSKSTVVNFSSDGSELTFSNWNESCRRTAFTGLDVSADTSQLVGSWKNLSVTGGLDIITFGQDGTISYTCSDFDSLSREKQLEIIKELDSKGAYQYSFTDSSTISVYQQYEFFGDIRFVIYGSYMTLVTYDESTVTATTYCAAGAEDNTEPITVIASAAFSVKTTSMNYSNTDDEDASRHSFIQCQLPSISGAPAGSDIETFNGAMAELLSEVTAMISGGAAGQLYEITTNVYEHPGVVDIVMTTTAGGIYADTRTTWMVYHFDALTGESLSTSDYLDLFGVTVSQAKSWAAAVSGYTAGELTVYYDAQDRLYAIMTDGASPEEPVHIN